MKKINFSFPVVLIAAALVTLGACAKANNGSDLLDPNNPHQKEQVNAGVYPHTPAFRTTNAHGLAYLAQVHAAPGAKPNCTTCHGQDYTGSQKAAGCGTCHIQMPHPADWKDSHAAVAADSPTNCLLCHRNYTANMPNLGIGTCYSCHSETDELSPNPSDKLKWKAKPTPTPTPAAEPASN